MADRDILANIQRDVAVYMQHGTILNIAAGSNRYGVVVGTDDSAKPDTDGRGQTGVTDHMCARSDEAASGNDGTTIIERMEHHRNPELYESPILSQINLNRVHINYRYRTTVLSTIRKLQLKKKRYSTDT